VSKKHYVVRRRKRALSGLTGPPHHGPHFHRAPCARARNSENVNQNEEAKILDRLREQGVGAA
jgi:hypothetical protein